ncbi:MAG: hypothetical protein KBT08_06635 [Bacteroidales bacterium]|nr:hypothetical protein [Candidatus Cryptobacteroides onthequi]
MRTIKLVWLVIACVLILTGLISMTRHEPKSKEARRSYLIMVIGSFMSAVYFMSILIF